MSGEVVRAKGPAGRRPSARRRPRRPRSWARSAPRRRCRAAPRCHGAAPWLATLAVKGDGPLVDRASCGGALIAPDRPDTDVRGDVLRRGDLTVRTHARCAAQTPAVVGALG
ncbi:hypothetical protein SALB_00183 [Streptomyces noursei]|uniref:Uncharacterized protein n=1 Tax=Streptomyces noursei TaxID=1971 RepID=A0A401QQE4_STRNR|nr:hypothetical protein SALB_00183 [Streptomyces noursei]